MFRRHINNLTQQEAPEGFTDTAHPFVDGHNAFAHDALNCPTCSTNEKILEALATIVGINQTTLRKIEESEGVPHGIPFNFTQSNPVQSTVYTSPQTLDMGVVRSLMVGGPGNVTLKLQEPRTQILGGRTICVLPCAGSALPVPHRFIVPPLSTFTLSTDSAAGTGLLTVSVWIEPVGMSGPDFY